jgi:predicted negative regulator of RcsB-dependent stress response
MAKMATYDLEEQEQLDELKAWWKQYGNLVTGTLLALSLSFAGWKGWNWYSFQQATQASVVFNVLQRAVGERDQPRVKSAAGELLEKFGRSDYAPMAALLAGKAAFEGGDLKTARVQFSWAADHASSQLKDMATLRLAAVLADEKSFEESIKLLNQSTTPHFEGLFADARGDVLLAQGKRAEAKVAYQLALKKKMESVSSGTGEERSTGFKEVVQQKLDALGDA